MDGSKSVLMVMNSDMQSEIISGAGTLLCCVVLTYGHTSNAKLCNINRAETKCC